MNQDGLENYFGCLRSYCHSSSIIPMHFRSAYSTSFINNLSSSHSIKSNCEPDLSKPLLNEMNEFFLSDNNENNDTVEAKSVDSNLNCIKNDGYEYDYDPITIDVEFCGKKINCLDNNSVLSDSCNTVCNKILQVTDCHKCRKSLETPIYQDKTSQNTINQPSDLFKKNFLNIINDVNIILPQICEQKLLQKKLLKYINDDKNIDKIGCSRHNAYIDLKIKEFTIVSGIQSFCKNINDFLSGKNLKLTNASNFIEEKAFKFNQKKKQVGKHSDIFKIQN